MRLQLLEQQQQFLHYRQQLYCTGRSNRNCLQEASATSTATICAVVVAHLASMTFFRIVMLLSFPCRKSFVPFRPLARPVPLLRPRRGPLPPRRRLLPEGGRTAGALRPHPGVVPQPGSAGRPRGGPARHQGGGRAQDAAEGGTGGRSQSIVRKEL